MEKKINYIVREYPPESCELSWAFEDDGLTERGGDWNYNLFIVSNDGWGRLSGFNVETYEGIRKEAENMMDDFEQVIGRESLYAGWTYKSYKEVMESYGIPYNPRKCHALKEWAKSADNLDTDDIAEYLTITTGKKWRRIGVHGYCQGDYVDVVYCEDFHENPKYYGECWLGCAKEFSVNYLDENGEEEDSVGGYIVADCQAWRDEDYKRLVCEWAGIPEDETELQMIDGFHTYTKYDYRTA